ncbi:MAG: type II toxin-antitoxin system RelE/ParE family toxin [Acidobacteriota bacterium]
MPRGSSDGFELRWSEEAVGALRQIHRHIERDRPHTAARTVESIVARMASLAASPHLGQRYPYADDPNLFQLTYGHFRIAYRVDAPTVVVLAVFHGFIFLPQS